MHWFCLGQQSFSGSADFIVSTIFSHTWQIHNKSGFPSRPSLISSPGRYLRPSFPVCHRLHRGYPSLLYRVTTLRLRLGSWYQFYARHPILIPINRGATSSVWRPRLQDLGSISAYRDPYEWWACVLSNMVVAPMKAQTMTEHSRYGLS